LLCLYQLAIVATRLEFIELTIRALSLHVRLSGERYGVTGERGRQRLASELPKTLLDVIPGYAHDPLI
jgi:hypothetical protein